MAFTWQRSSGTSLWAGDEPPTAAAGAFFDETPGEWEPPLRTESAASACLGESQMMLNL